jgi:hypothetical protein
MWHAQRTGRHERVNAHVRHGLGMTGAAGVAVCALLLLLLLRLLLGELMVPGPEAVPSAAGPVHCMLQACREGPPAACAAPPVMRPHRVPVELAGVAPSGACI